MTCRKAAMKAPLLLCALAIPAAAAAQAQGDPIAERVGPNASQAAPEFQEPAEFPQSQVPDSSPTNVSGDVLLGDVMVADNGDPAGFALRDWINEPGQLALALKAGDAMDAAWIRQQFQANGMLSGRIPLDQIATLVQTINRAFVANGFINSGVLIAGAPPEDGGTLQLRLVSGRLLANGFPGLAVTWADDRRSGLDEAFIARRMSAAEGVPLNVIAIEEQFRLLAEDPNIRTVNADLRPGSDPGEAQLILTIEPENAFDLYVSTANSRSPSIGGERYSLGASMRNALTSGDFLSVEGGLTGGLPDLVAGYQVPVGGPNTFLRARGGFNKAAVIDPELLALNIKARDWHIEGGVSHNLVHRPLMPDGDGWRAARTITLGLTMTHRQSNTELLGQPFSFSPGSVDGRTEYTAVRLTADLVQRGMNEVFALSAIATQGLDGTQSVLPGLLSPDPDFRSIRGQFNYARRLTEGGLQLRVRLVGQFADGIIYSGERFAAGGVETVRGYRETLILADTGVVGSMELAQNFTLSPNRNMRSSFDWGAFSASAFVDGAYVGNREGSPVAADHLASVGLGLSWVPSPAISTRISYAISLNEVAAPGSRDLQDRGVHFRVTIRPLLLLGLQD